MFLLAYVLQSDKLTDISYAVTFAALGILGFVYGPQDYALAVLLTMILAWAVRLGGYLLYRVIKKGKDQRFDEMRSVFLKFGRFWLLQGLTVAIVMIPSMFALSNGMDEISFLSALGLLIFSAGFVIETVADFEKNSFNNDPKNKGKWIQSGIWGWSRHPNFLGEMMVWIGVYLYALPVLSGVEAVVSLVSPLYIIGLLYFGSGVPILERYADKKWGDQKEYKEYKERVGKLIPKFK